MDANFQQLLEEIGQQQSLHEKHVQELLSRQTELLNQHAKRLEDKLLLAVKPGDQSIDLNTRPEDPVIEEYDIFESKPGPLSWTGKAAWDAPGVPLEDEPKIRRPATAQNELPTSAPTLLDAETVEEAEEERGTRPNKSKYDSRSLKDLSRLNTTDFESFKVKKRPLSSQTEKADNIKGVDEQMLEMQMARDQMTKGLNKAIMLAAFSGRDENGQPKSCWAALSEVFLVIVQSRHFELTSAFLIMSNAVCVGADVDYGIRYPGDDVPAVFRALDIMFLVMFTLELILRLLADGPLFFYHYRNFAVRWNLMDTVLVLISLVEEILSIVSAGSSELKVDVMRLFRILRLVRAFRIIRVVRVFRDLRIMLAGIVSSLRAMMWAMLLLLAIMYLVAVSILQLANEEFNTKAKDPSSGALSATDFAELKECFGGIMPAIYTLYLSITGGKDWGDAVRPLMGINAVLPVVFVFYIAFAVLCVLNIITGQFVENANRMTAKDEELVFMEQMTDRQRWLRELKSLFSDADEDGDGLLSREEFKDRLEDVKMQAWFRKIGIEVETYSADGLFRLLDFDDSGSLDINEFATSLDSLHGTARSIDVVKVIRDTRRLKADIEEVSTSVAEVITMLHRLEDRG